MMKYIYLIVASLHLVLAGLPSESAAQSKVPEASVKPLEMMKPLEVLQGKWSMVMEIPSEDGKTWQSMPPEIVNISFRHKGMVLAEVPTDLSTPAFHMETYISYDQYRMVYRKIAIDDMWGMMDIYEGKRVGNKIVFDNLKSGTTFPVAENTWRNFRLHLEIGSPRRTLHIEKSDDDGATWQSAFRVTYDLVKE